MSVCGTCGSQSTTFKEGVSKKTGRAWKAYDCNDCKNEKGYPTRTFASNPKRTTATTSNSLEKKVDKILAILKANFKDVTSSSEDEGTPF